MDTNLIMAIIALAAIISPAIVSIIDNIFKYKIKKLELKYQNQCKALSDFSYHSMNNFNTANFKKTTEYINAKCNLYVYFKNVPSKLIHDLENCNNLSNYKNILNSIIEQISKQLNK